MQRSLAMLLATMGVAMCACLDNEFTLADACYTYNRTTRMSWEDGVKFCGEKGMQLFSPNSRQELESVLYHSVSPAFTWLGGTGKEVNFDKESITLSWVDGEGMPVEDIPWAINTDTHGLTSAARCLAFYNAGVATAANKVSFVPCNTLTNVIVCERKAIDLPKKTGNDGKSVA